MRREPLSPHRRFEIRNMRRSVTEAIPVAVYNDARAESASAAARTVNEHTGSGGLTHVFAHVLVRTLVAHPIMHAGIDGDDLLFPSDVNLGIAVAGPDGTLAVPIVHAAQDLGFRDLTARIDDMSERARAKKLRPEDVRGGGFTLSNVGMVMRGGQGIGVIPPGQAGLLVIGGVREVPVVEDGDVVPGTTVPLSLTFDHRIANGVAAWRFFADLIANLERVSLEDLGVAQDSL